MFLISCKVTNYSQIIEVAIVRAGICLMFCFRRKIYGGNIPNYRPLKYG